VPLPVEQFPGLAVRSLLSKPATCRTIQAVKDDTCDKLASKCGAHWDDFIKYNPKSDLCTNLVVGQHVCCNDGAMPDLKPKGNPDGPCSSWMVQPDESCISIGTSKGGLTVAELESFNEKVWGWTGYVTPQMGIRMCVSKGTPKPPNPFGNAVCGPQKPGSRHPNAGEDIAKMNPCPLNACCNIWGQCGTTSDFCTRTKATGKLAWYSGDKENACISKCGTDIFNNKKKPAKFMDLGYFESWNPSRPCLNMDVSEIPAKHTHVHFAFGEISKDFKVDLSKTKG